MDDYTTRRGTRRSRAHAPNHYALPYRERPDDGAVGVGHTCRDCGVGTLRWAEAGYVAWHRICDVCGSHWDARPITYYRSVGRDVSMLPGETGAARIPHPDAAPTVERITCAGGNGCDIAVDPAARHVSHGDGAESPPHAEMLAVAEWTEQDQRTTGIAAVGASQWYRRARFYR